MPEVGAVTVVVKRVLTVTVSDTTCAVLLETGFGTPSVTPRLHKSMLDAVWETPNCTERPRDHPRKRALKEVVAIA